MYPPNLDNPFQNTGFSYCYEGVGSFTLNPHGWVNAVIIREDCLIAKFIKPITEPYSIHVSASAGKDKPPYFVYVKEYDEKGFTIASAVENQPIRFMEYVSVGIFPYSPELLETEEMRIYLND